jgi:hypothetical protein
VFEVESKDSTTIRIFDVNNREISEPFSQVLEPGAYLIKFDAVDVQSGVYLVWYKVGEWTRTRKIVLVR